VHHSHILGPFSGPFSALQTRSPSFPHPELAPGRAAPCATILRAWLHRSPDGSYPVTIVAPPPAPPISAGSLPLRLLSLSPILRTPLSFPDMAGVHPTLEYNRPPAGLVLLVSAPSAMSPVWLFRLLPVAPRSFLVRPCSHIVVGTALFPLLPCLLGRDFQIPLPLASAHTSRPLLTPFASTRLTDTSTRTTTTSTV